MVLKLYNSLIRDTEAFKPIVQGKVSMYSCGPTVYNYAHIGNFRAYLSSDVLRRYLEYKGFKVLQVMNLTDVDDKTIKGSIETGLSLNEFTQKFKDIFFEDIDTLNIERATEYPSATTHIQEMIKIIEILLDKDIAYKGEDGSIYYSISKFKTYGELAHIKVDELKAGARVKQDEYEKDTAHDFALWKAYDEDDGDVKWDAPFGVGRPGWHLECSAMSMKYLGSTFDIHTGGADLIFPHHQNEIAQSEAVTGKKFVNYWVHNGWLLVEGKKMSKSSGNFYTLRDLISKGHKAKAIRYLLLSTHYRMPLNFTEDGLKAAEASLQRLIDFVDKLEVLKNKESVVCVESSHELAHIAKQKFEEAMDDDLNISEALGVVFEFVHGVNKLIAEDNLCASHASEIYNLMMGFDKVLGVLAKDDSEKVIDKDIDELIQKREQARKDKDFATADKIRDDLKEQGIVLEDTGDGVRWKRV